MGIIQKWDRQHANYVITGALNVRLITFLVPCAQNVGVTETQMQHALVQMDYTNRPNRILIVDIAIAHA